ncbi:MAG: hypothetical protein ACREKS_07700 [Candidatus Rokuibacteriota bacterium]
MLVEGLPRSGKSTTAQWIAHKLASQGRAVRWIYEEEVTAPPDPTSASRTRYPPGPAPGT